MPVFHHSVSYLCTIPRASKALSTLRTEIFQSYSEKVCRVIVILRNLPWRYFFFFASLSVTDVELKNGNLDSLSISTEN